MMKLQIFPVQAFRDNYIWIIHNTRYAAIVDPGDAQPALNYLQSKKLQPIAILITHHHSDHTGGNQRLLDLFDIPVYGPQQENIPTVTHPVHEGDTVHLKALSLMLDIIDIPGHTHGHIAYYGVTQDEKMLFCGDTLFVCGCGRVFEGTPRQMFCSLQKLADLSDDTKVYSTHEYTLSNIKFAKTVEPNNLDLQKQAQHAKQLRDNNKPTLPTSIAAEKSCNPFLRCHKQEIIQSASSYAGTKLHGSIDVFTALREWKNRF